MTEHTLTEESHSVPRYEHIQAPDAYTPDDIDHTVVGYIELLSDLSETQRALSADFRVAMAEDREGLERLAQPHILAINDQREKSSDAALDVAQLSDHFLMGVAEPAWKSYMPRDPNDEAQVAAWEQFKKAVPVELHPNLEALYELHAKVDALQTDEALMVAFEEQHKSKRVHVVRAATHWRKREAEQEKLKDQIVQIQRQAGRRYVASGRGLTRLERGKIAAIQNEINKFDPAEMDPAILLAADPNELKAELDRLCRRDDKKDLDKGLLLTDQMKEIIGESLPALMRGEPTLLVGETGGAKSALAKYLARHLTQNVLQRDDGNTFEFVSGSGNVTAHQIIGKNELREVNGATITEFIPGPLIRAMEAGVPFILDEVDAVPADELKRFNDIMLLRPGDSFKIQEDSGRSVTIQEGFCIIVTANEKSKRYKGIDDLSTEFRSRFAANSYRVRYADDNVAYGNNPVENERLAFAAICDQRGALPPDVDPDGFDNFVRAAFVSQQLFTGKHGEVFDQNVPNALARSVDKTPGLKENVLAPRAMVDILRKVAGSNGELGFSQACSRYLDSIKDPEDKAVFAVIFNNYKLISNP